jgi:hypothetical protein
MSRILSESLILSAANSKFYTLVVCEAYNQGIFSVYCHGFSKSWEERSVNSHAL